MENIIIGVGQYVTHTSWASLKQNAEFNSSLKEHQHLLTYTYITHSYSESSIGF